MKCTIPEISWHNREPVFSVDIYPENAQFYRLATSGGDCHVLIWQMNIAQNGAVHQELISDLTRHQRSVNCVRWSSSGKYLASGDDDANIIVWQLQTDNIPLLEGETGDKETWIVYKILRGHKEDVYDICWSIDDSKILSGSVDNTAILWDVTKGKMDHILSDHKGFVQGVAWDPKNQLTATISTDRVCRVFNTTGKQVKARIHKGKITAVPEGHFLRDKEVKYFHDDTFKSFFRRLQFTPDGSLLIVPSGHLETENCKSALNATLIFTLDNFSVPAVILPIPRLSSTVVRCCPVLYELREEGPEPIIKLPYRMVFAVGTDHDIILYDTQQVLPFARFQDIHYTRLTDLSWSHDGLLLIASSTDGFCSLITFELDELGVPWLKTESDCADNTLDISGCEELLEKDENVDITNKSVTLDDTSVLQETKKRSSFLEQWALKTPSKKRKLEENCDKKRPSSCDRGATEIIEILDSPQKKLPEGQRTREVETEVALKISDDNCRIPSTTTPRRIKPILLQAKQSSTRTENDHSKPNEEVKTFIHVSTTADVASVNSNDEGDVQLSEKERKSLEQASQSIKEFFSRNPRRDFSNSSEAKPIAVKRKPQNLEAKPIAARKNVAEPSSPGGILLKAEEIAKIDEKNNITTENVEVLTTASDIECKEEYKITPKKTKGTTKDREAPPKIKVSSLVKKGKSSNVTPKKAKNSLLNFLTKSSEKDKRADEVLREESAARDSWTCDVSKEQSQVTAAADPIVADDDCSEDFRLQLEESQEAADERTTNEATKSTSIYGNENRQEILAQSSTPKTPRRVQLITLSSPGNKPKKLK